MKTWLRPVALGLLLLVPAAAHAAAPSVSPISDLTSYASGTVTVNVVAVDVDGDAITLTSSLPGFAVLNSPTSGSGIVVTTITADLLFVGVGTHTASVTATAGGESDTEEFTITVVTPGSDLPPTVNAPATAGGLELGEFSISFAVTASDPNQDAITSWTAAPLPLGATFTPGETNTFAEFYWEPKNGQAGHYDIVFTASNALSGSATTHITVGESDIPPAMVAIPDVTLAEGDSVIVNVTVIDSDSSDINLSASGLPSFATLNPPTTSTGTDLLRTTLTLEPETGDAGSYAVALTAMSTFYALSDTFMITVTSGGQNDPPVVHAPDSRTVDEGEPLTVSVTAEDENGDDVALTASGLPSGATFVDHGDNTAALAWTPGFDQAGTYNVTITGNDGQGGIDTHALTITVNDVTGSMAEGFAFVTGGNVTTRLRSGKPFTCVQIEPLHNSFSVEDVTLSSITMSHLGNTIQVAAGSAERSRDTNRNGIPEVRACFSKEDLRTLFGGLDPGENLVNVIINGALVSGDTFQATFAHRVVVNANGNPSPLNPKVRPNPLNPRAEISFTLTQPGVVRIALYDLRGRLVKTILNEDRMPGDHVVSWDASAGNNEVASGVYFLKIEARQGEEVRRVTVLK